MKITVTGAGGFIGGHLVADLLEKGHEVRAVDIKDRRFWYQIHDTQNLRLDLRLLDDCRAAVTGAERVFNLAADMGGIGYISTHKREAMLSVLINTHLLQAAEWAEVERYFYSSSACVYGQGSGAQGKVRERDAYPAHCEDGYGWEKLFSERMCRHFNELVPTRVARYHNVYGPHGTYVGGREKAPAAICYKVAKAIHDESDTLEIWGDGQQLRSFMHISDCIEGTHRIMDGEWADPVNLGSDQVVSIDQLADLVEGIAGTELTRTYNPTAAQGVRTRNSDNSFINYNYEWAPSVPLREGLGGTYEWIAEQVGIDARNGEGHLRLDGAGRA